MPFAHAVQDAESATAQVPAMQPLYAARSAAAPVDGPAAQAVHAAPVPAMHWPATHAVQSSAESFEASLARAVRSLPFAHVMQDAVPATARVQAMHAMHSVRPVAAPVD